VEGLGDPGREEWPGGGPAEDAGRVEQREREAEISSLAARYRCGDRSVLGELFARLEPAIWAVLWRHMTPPRSLPPGVDPEDLSQQAYVALAETALEWDAERHRNFLPYFLRSFPWRIDRYLRSQSPSRRSGRFRLESVSHDLLMDLVAELPGSDGREWDDALLCRELVGGLPRLYGRVVELHLHLGLSFAEVGEALGISRSAAHESFVRAIAAARALVNGQGAGGMGQGPGEGVDHALLLRCVETLHRLAPGGAPLPGRDLLRREVGLTWRQYGEIMARLRARGCVVGRGRGSAGRLACATPAETMRRLEASAQQP